MSHMPHITATGWRLWNLIQGRDLYPERLTRGLIVRVDAAGCPIADNDKQIHADELAVILKEESAQPLAIHFCTAESAERCPELLTALCERYPLSGHVFQINKRIQDPVAEALLPIKARFGLRVILQHYNLLNVSPEDPVVQLADQVLVDVGGGRGRQAIDPEGKHRTLLAKIAALTPVSIGLAGRLSADAVRELTPALPGVAELVKRPVAFDAESQLRHRNNLDLEKVRAYTEACLLVR